MKKEIETKKDGKEFDRFDDLFRKVVSVPKTELDKREAAEKAKKAAKKK
jgi:hypothetical protein